MKLEFVGLDALQIPVISSQWSVVSICYGRLIRSPIAGHWPLVTGHLLSNKLKFTTNQQTTIRPVKYYAFPVNNDNGELRRRGFAILRVKGGDAGTDAVIHRK